MDNIGFEIHHLSSSEKCSQHQESNKSREKQEKCISHVCLIQPIY